ncbi:MAG TPA: PLP-dependent aminotransferase family protein [Thermomicrobiales bacterium]
MSATSVGATTVPGAARLARRSKAFETSPWSDAWQLVADRPDGIYFGNGAPGAEAVPMDRLQEAAVRAWAEAAGNLDYGELQGYQPLRELIARRMAHRGVQVDPDEIMVTNGSQQGIDLIARLLVDPGDTVVIEGPTYIGAMQAFDAYETRYLIAPVDDEGIVVEELARLLDRAGAQPKLLYTVPTYQNPTGATQSPARREALLALCADRGIPVVEDDPYGELYYGAPPPPALRASDPNVFYLGSFSKTIAPGLRVGWMIAPRPLLKLLLMAKEGADVHSNRVAMRTVYHAAEGFLDEHVAGLRTHYRQRRDILLDGLRAHFPASVRWLEPEGGFFVWAELPDGLSADDLLPVAASYGVAFLPGSYFYPPDQRRHSGFRLSYSSLPEPAIDEGARRLGEAIAAFLASAERR